MIRKESRIINDKKIELFFDTDRQAYQVAEDAMNMLLENTEILKCYEDKEAQKQLFYVPCKVGDIVYRLNKAQKKIETKKVVHIAIYIYRENRYMIHIEFENCEFCRGSDFGTTVFATKTEAIAIMNMQEDKQ